MIINYNQKTIQVKLVYYGPAMSGKTTSLKYLFKKFNKTDELTSIETTTGRTLFFDFGLLNFKGSDWTIKILMYSATGQDFYASTRPSTLTGADGIIFVADSNAELMGDNIQSWNELKGFFKEFNKVPIVICLNKQDLPNPITEEDLKTAIQLHEFENLMIYKTIATEGNGILDSFKTMLGFIFKGILVSV